MKSADTLELPRLTIRGPRFFPVAELLRWVCEDRSFSYIEKAEQVRFPLSANQLQVVSALGTNGGLLKSLEFIDRRCRAGERVFGEQEEQRAANMDRVGRYLAGISKSAIELWLAHLADSPSLLRRISTANSSSLKSGIDVSRALSEAEAALTEVEAELTTKGTQFLSGSDPGLQDIYLAALAYPLVLPAKASILLPAYAELPQALRDIVDRFRSRRAGALIADTYDRLRPDRQPVLPAPTYGPSLVERILNPTVVRYAAQLLVKLAPRFQIGSRLIVSDWKNVTEVLDRDNDFLIAPVNKKRIDAVSGPFILGMDRSPELLDQREHVYAAVRDTDRGPFNQILQTEPRRLLDAAVQADGKIDVVNEYARLVAGRTAAAFFGVRGPTEQDLLRVIRSIFHETFLNQGNDAEVSRRGIAAGVEFREWISAEQARRTEQGDIRKDVLGNLMVSTGGNMEFSRWMMAGLQVGAIDTTTTVVANIITEVVADRQLKAAMTADVNNPQKLIGWCWEALRRRPHNSGMLRQAGRDATLAGTSVPEGTQILLLTVGAMHDPAAFDDPNHLRPDRPLDRYLHFGRGLHQCSGRDLNAIQIPLLVRELLLRDVSSHSPVRTSGPFPDELIVNIRTQS